MLPDNPKAVFSKLRPPEILDLSLTNPNQFRYAMFPESGHELRHEIVLIIKNQVCSCLNNSRFSSVKQKTIKGKKTWTWESSLTWVSNVRQMLTEDVSMR